MEMEGKQYNYLLKQETVRLGVKSSIVNLSIAKTHHNRKDRYEGYLLFILCISIIGFYDVHVWSNLPSLFGIVLFMSMNYYPNNLAAWTIMENNKAVVDLKFHCTNTSLPHFLVVIRVLVWL
jgi:hypothetical protein